MRVNATPRWRHVALMVTRRCNMSCGHCSVRSSPKVQGQPSRDEILALVEEAAATDVATITVTGGEPMLRPELVFDVLRLCKEHRISTAVNTNGTWAKSARVAEKTMRRFADANIERLVISYDKYHAEFAGTEALSNIVEFSDRHAYIVQLNIVRGRDDDEIGEILKAVEDSHSIRTRFYDLQPVGRATELGDETYREDIDGLCSSCAAPALTDDGRLTACNGPSYFQRASSPLVIGSVSERPLADLIDQHEADPVLQIIRTQGPTGLQRILQQTKYGETFPFRASYRGMCDLCLHLCGDQKAVGAIRSQLDEPSTAAELLGRDQVVRNRRLSQNTRDKINRSAAAAQYLRLAGLHHPAQEIGREQLAAIFSRADFDWNHHSKLLSECGLARPLYPALLDEVGEWAPTFFVERLQRTSIAAATRAMVQRHALEEVERVLARENVTGTLLKGAALLDSWAESDGEAIVADSAIPIRDTGDIDILLPADQASRIRSLLIEQGFDGDPKAPRSAAHHLSPIAHNGIDVEIHTSIMPSVWSLPEHEMLQRALPIEGRPHLQRLDPAGYLLHSMVHCSGHLFSHGLKSAWDLLWSLHHASPEDIETVARWSRSLRAPLSFSVPLHAIANEISLNLPQSLRQPLQEGHFPELFRRRLDLIARRRLFQQLDNAYEVDPLAKNAVFLMLQASPFNMMRHLLLLTTGKAREARTNQNSTLSKARRNGGQLTEAKRYWRQYRRARRFEQPK